MLYILLKIITIATLLCVAFLFYYDVKTLMKMYCIACRLGKEKDMSKFKIICACLMSKYFFKTFISCMLNLFCVIILLMILFK